MRAYNYDRIANTVLILVVGLMLLRVELAISWASQRYNEKYPEIEIFTTKGYYTLKGPVVITPTSKEYFPNIDAAVTAFELATRNVAVQDKYQINKLIRESTGASKETNAGSFRGFRAMSR